MKEDNDYNSLWTIKNAQGTPHILPGKFLFPDKLILTLDEKVLCGNTIRLEHVLTKKNLHTHDFQSPVSGKSEVSCFGQDGNGDTGINF